MNSDSSFNTFSQYDELTSFMQQRLQQTTLFLEQQLQEVAKIMSARLSSPQRTMPPTNKLLSLVPATDNSQLPTLLFTKETSGAFLKTVGRSLFAKLKKVTKRWYANVPDTNRKQVARMVTEMTRAIIDGRISLITEKDLEAYRRRVQQALGDQPVCIPDDQLITALARKVRVYIQNSRKKQDAWVQNYSKFISFGFPIPIHLFNCVCHDRGTH